MTGAEVSCPKNVKAKKGVTFTCKVTINGTAHDYDVEIEDVNGDDLSLATSWKEGVALSRQKVIEILTPSVEEKIGQKPTIDCGEDPLLFVKESELVCDVSAGEQKGKLHVALEGDVIQDWKIEAE